MKDIPHNRPVLILGIGNILLSDEGAGIRAVEYLRDNYTLPEDVETVDGGTVGIELLPFIEGRSLIIIADAVNTGHSHGTVTKIEDLPAYFKHRTSPHQLGITDVLALASLSETTPPKTLLFGIEPKSLDTGIGLSPEVEARLPYLVEKIVEELKDMGFGIQAKEPLSRSDQNQDIISFHIPGKSRG